MQLTPLPLNGLTGMRPAKPYFIPCMRLFAFKFKAGHALFILRVKGIFHVGEY